jgi:hypothetical protein
MRPWMIAPLVALHLALMGCGPGVPAVPPGAPVVVVPMTLVQTNHNPPPKLLQLGADGTISGPNGEPLGKLSGTKIVDGKGKELLSIAPDGTIVSAEVTRKMKFNEEGELTDEKGSIKIGSDGTVITQDAGADLTRTPMKFEGYTPAARRTGIVLLVFIAKHLGNVADLGL